MTPSAAYGYGNGNMNMNMNPFSPVATVGAPPSPFALGAGPVPSPYEYEYPLQNPHYQQQQQQQYPQYPHQEGFGAPPVPGMHNAAPYGTYVNHITPPGSPVAGGGYAYEERNNSMAAAGMRSISSPPPLHSTPVKNTALPDPFASPVSPLNSPAPAHAKELPLPPPLLLSSPPPSLPLLLPLTSPLRLSSQHRSTGASSLAAAAAPDPSSCDSACSEAQVGQAVKVQVQVQGSAAPVVYEELRREEGFGSSPPLAAAAAEEEEEGGSPVSPSTDTSAPAPTTDKGKKKDNRPASAYTLYDPEDAYGGM